MEEINEHVIMIELPHSQALPVCMPTASNGKLWGSWEQSKLMIGDFSQYSTINFVFLAVKTTKLKTIVLLTYFCSVMPMECRIHQWVNNQQSM